MTLCLSFWYATIISFLLKRKFAFVISVLQLTAQ